MKLRIIREVGRFTPRKYPVPGSYRPNVDVKVTIVDSNGTELTYYDNEREKLSEEDEDK